MLNENVRKMRMARRMSQVELARKLGVTKQSVSNWENDNIQPSIEMLVKIAECLNASTDYLLGLSARKTVDVDGLTDTQIAHIQMLVDDLRALSREGACPV